MKNAKHMVVAIVMAVVWCGGCAPSASAYRRVLKQHQRHGEFFDFNTMRAELMWDAVWLTPELRSARADREAVVRRLPQDTSAPLAPAEWFGAGMRFYLNIFVPKDTGDPSSQTGAWRLELRDAAGRRHTPTTFTEVPIAAVDRKLFPFLTPWSRTYIVVFPTTVDHPFALTLYGLHASSTLQWK